MQLWIHEEYFWKTVLQESVAHTQCKISHHGDIEFHSGINLVSRNERTYTPSTLSL